MTEPVVDNEGCWQHGTQSIVMRSEPAICNIQHCTICDKDVAWDYEAAVVAEAMKPYARLVVDGTDVDKALMLTDPIYKGIVTRIHQGR